MQINRASEAQVNSPHKALRSVFKKYGHMPCKHCGSILDRNGRHTDAWVRTWQIGTDKHRSRMYRVWGAMLERCRNPNQERYSSYGGRGIKVCAEWKDFAVFREWALSAGYAPGLQIDRLDQEGEKVRQRVFQDIHDWYERLEGEKFGTDESRKFATHFRKHIKTGSDCWYTGDWKWRFS